jgi:WD40 repeat protein
MMTIEQSKDISLPTTVHDVALPPKGTSPAKVWTACLDGTVCGVDLEEGSHFVLGRHRSYASGVHALPEGNTVISAGYDGRLLWHDVKKRQCFRSVQAHRFWSWKSALSPDGQWIASSTGQYLCGGYRYEPAGETEPSVKVFSTHTGDLKAAFSHQPPVQAVTFSRDGRYLAAGNLMGAIQVWELASQRLVAQWETREFTGWGIIKGHYFTGGVFGLTFGPGDDALYLVGMGSTRDPAAGNGKQKWQAYRWQQETPEKVGEASDDETGQGLMETLVFDPTDQWFLMAGRLESGQWNCATFERATGGLRASHDFKGRVCQATFLDDQGAFLLAGGISQGGPKENGQFRHYGRLWKGQAQRA